MQKYWYMALKRTGRCSVKPQRYIPQKHWKIFWKDAKSLSAEQQGKFYRKNWDMFCKKTERCSTKILIGFLQKKAVLSHCWTELHALTQKEQLSCKNLLREKCPNTEFFLARIQQKCGKIRTRKKLRIWTLFTHWLKDYFCYIMPLCFRIWYNKQLLSA